MSYSLTTSILVFPIFRIKPCDFKNNFQTLVWFEKFRNDINLLKLTVIFLTKSTHMTVLFHVHGRVSILLN